MEFKAKDRRMEGETTLRQCQLVQLYLLEVLDEICKKYGLRYFLDFGTLLGALRHGGAIPWDDDLDVSMPEEDYFKFLSVAPGELSNEILLQTPMTNGGAFTGTSRLRDCKSFYLEGGWCYPRASGIFVDIYPLICRRYYPKFIGKKMSQLRALAVCSEIGNRIEINYTIIQLWRHAIMALFWRAINLFSEVFRYIVSIFGRKIWTMTPELEGRFWQFENDDIFPLGSHLYEGREFPIPHNAEKILEKYYGNWKELPPEADRQPYSKMKMILPLQMPKFQ